MALQEPEMSDVLTTDGQGPELIEARATDLELIITNVLDRVAVGLDGSEDRKLQLGNRDNTITYNATTKNVQLDYCLCPGDVSGLRRDRIVGKKGEYEVTAGITSWTAGKKTSLRDYIKGALTANSNGVDWVSNHEAEVLPKLKKVFQELRTITERAESAYQAFIAEEPKATPADAEEKVV